ncbi:VOC family protein [Dyella nitratireducens]|uniref:VOC family protein n=1 Tax=Dyella nitratireducens TaxID=1849580 RepID=A0ABQ1FND6_9GAMM|nr:VOC family protein [Dyella nitratireducens]GGA22260.1 VOC family protein [Dyella nitratireducens]GLQ44133.1 VOC family protein [Dyella nitratireducens]
MAHTITPFLMFEGAAEEAMQFYVSLFDDSRIVSVERWGAHDVGKEGKIKKAQFTLCGRSFYCSDSPIEHGFTFTPSLSLFIDVDSEANLEWVFSLLAAGGKVLMPLDNYGFSKRFGWANDRFGVSWQLNLPE